MLQMAFALSLQEQQLQSSQSRPPPGASATPPVSGSNGLESQEPHAESIPPSLRGELVRQQPASSRAAAADAAAATGSSARDDRSSLAHVSAAVSESGASSQNISRASTPPPAQEPAPSAATSSRPSESAQGQASQTPRDRPVSFGLSEAASLNVLNDLPVCSLMHTYIFVHICTSVLYVQY